MQHFSQLAKWIWISRNWLAQGNNCIVFLNRAFKFYIFYYARPEAAKWEIQLSYLFLVMVHSIIAGSFSLPEKMWLCDDILQQIKPDSKWTHVPIINYQQSTKKHKRAQPSKSKAVIDSHYWVIHYSFIFVTRFSYHKWVSSIAQK